MSTSEFQRPRAGISGSGASHLTGSEKPRTPKRAGDFRCFQCRRYFGTKDGDWVKWESMEVHLCHTCDRETRELPERRSS